MTDKLALITGACGYSAPWTIRLLLEQGYRVRATDLAGAPRDGLAEFSSKIEFVPADITKPETLKSLFADVDVLFHPAAMFSYSAPMPILRKVNVEGTKNLLDAAVNSMNCKKMVMWSSIAAYGQASPKFYPMPIPEVPLDKMNPKTGGRYDLSKREQEAVATKVWEEHKYPMTFMRCAPLYGPGSYYGIYVLLKYIKYEVLSIAPTNLHKASVPLVHTSDVARAAIHLSDPTKFNGEAYNVADDNVLDMIETFQYVARLTNSAFSVMAYIPPIILFPVFQIIGAWSLWQAKHLRKKINGKAPLPKLETDTLLYLFGNFWFDNKKLKDTGFTFKYADRRPGLIEAVDWYEKNGWEKKIAIKGVD